MPGSPSRKSLLADGKRRLRRGKSKGLVYIVPFGQPQRVAADPCLESRDDLRRYRALHTLQIHRLRGRLSGRLFPRGPNFLVIDPEECIDCTLCVAECPVEAIYSEDDVPDDQKVTSR